MKTELGWHRHKDDPANPIIEIKHNQYCGETCPKHITFRLGSEVVEIRTDDDGLKRIAAAIAEHPAQMLREAEAKFEAAKQEFERMKPANTE